MGKQGKLCSTFSVTYSSVAFCLILQMLEKQNFSLNLLRGEKPLYGAQLSSSVCLTGLRRAEPSSESRGTAAASKQRRGNVERRRNLSVASPPHKVTWHGMIMAHGSNRRSEEERCSSTYSQHTVVLSCLWVLKISRRKIMFIYGHKGKT